MFQAPEAPPMESNSALARSRSRYKGNRLGKQAGSTPGGLATSSVDRTATLKTSARSRHHKNVLPRPTFSDVQQSMHLPEESNPFGDPVNTEIPWSPTATHSGVRNQSTQAMKSKIDDGLQVLKLDSLAHLSNIPPERREQKSTKIAHRRRKSGSTDAKEVAAPLRVDTKNVTGDEANSQDKHWLRRSPFKPRLSPHEVQHVKAQEGVKPSTNQRVHGPISKPAFDAPISAINAGERRVAVEYLKSVVSVPVTTSTTPVDVINIAASELRLRMDVDTTLVLESFRQLGLERPIRKYEHIRDVLNSWDNDAQNALLLIPSTAKNARDDLNSKRVLKQPPVESSMQLYYSQRPSHWDKRLVSLRADGQILTSNKGSSTNICHLSDFDIYLPTKRQLSKKIKPPKKFCFAIKSQQKSAMFLSTENFVHFFSTKDKASADQWYSAVQEWRSWYLVNILGEGQGVRTDGQVPHHSNRQQNFQDPVLPEGVADRYSHTARRASTQQHKMQGFSVSSKQPEKPPREYFPTRRGIGQPDLSQGLSRNTPSKGIGTRLRGDSVMNTSAKAPPPIDLIDSEPFASTGLLGRSYTVRKNAQHEREARDSSGQTVTPRYSRDSGNNLNRTLSRKPNERPLVDLTPSNFEPPQFRKGRGMIPDQIPAGGLIEAATSPERAIDIPPASSPQRSGTLRRPRDSSPPLKTSARQQPESSTSNPFPSGLLRNQTVSQDGIGHGRRVKTSHRDTKTPMIDLVAPSQYAPGSLPSSMQ
ncbi:uncharacterized protein KY384_005312 [Bacidia gigantensis]|uniref:uncharacterized protein n=1 Tax=Bacidia gigantensis TaxID=2732470 RepID=UPI001D0387F6|nr:uncharacterized protein KY384_005312 [Bacidia gigantensis]KAG8529831.1 hypothetical protein KY384_005312 [Bacidia gigantensis]